MKKNFRVGYLSSLGFSGSESPGDNLDSIFAEEITDLTKLQKFCMNYEVPTQYRSAVWKTILGVAPLCKQSKEFVKNERLQEYEDISTASQLLSKNNSAFAFLDPIFDQFETETEEFEKSKQVACNICKNFLVLERYSTIDQISNLTTPVTYSESECKSWILVANLLYSVCQNEEDTYFLLLRFIQKVKVVYSLNINVSKSTDEIVPNTLMSSLLVAHDQYLSKYFEEMKIDIDTLVFKCWFQNFWLGCKSVPKDGILKCNPTNLFFKKRILDKTIGVSIYYAGCVAVAFLQFLKPSFSKNSTRQSLEHLMKDIQISNEEMNGILKSSLMIFSALKIYSE